MSIFGQVWLWSLLAFFVGALVAWLVLVLPARKRVRELEEALAAAHAENARTPANAAALAATGTAVPAPVTPEFSGSETTSVSSVSSVSSDDHDFAEPDLTPSWARDEREHAPTELISATPSPGFEPEAEYEAEYRTAPDPEPVADDFEPAAAPSSVDSGAAYRAAATEYLNPVARDSGSGYHAAPEPAFEPDEEDHGSGYHRAPEPASIESKLEPEASFGATGEPVSLFQKPAAAPEPEARPETAESDWFTKERSPFEEPGDHEGTGDYLEEHEATEHLTPTSPPGAAAESVGSTESVESTEDSVEDSLEPGALPKRQPRESPRGGFEPPRPIEPSMRSVERRDPELTGAQSGSLFEPSVQPNQVAAAMAAPEPPPARQTPEDSVPPGPFGPGSAMPRPGGGRPSDAFTVKASVTALRYCTDESPQFPRMVAEVWFRTPADAERVGFRPLL
ncbi:hypothetical protein [Amycolatopsis sp. FDAARGOS 1241]|uniref:sunset domain-containing protein n=1 Tax=Amycolatopsis sp. FDAARGOS 1241 TaxID=2778070 RepID=UPI00195194AB|nr:hypothetical protein [Amycolatopsis sp. FDAARGOS 1241]QRP45465.1 hypothetical protein I6J71_41085 [Amycolatopsis sp. FDAARGOS 1241]